VDYRPSEPHGRIISSDPHLVLRADEDGVGFVQCDDGVLVVPLDEDGNVLLAVERSAALNRDVLVLAGGMVEPDEPLELTADRELQEELGWHADELIYLGELHPFKYLASRQFVFLARGLTPRRRAGDERHPIGVRRVPLASFASLCAAGELHDAPTIAALCLVQHFLGAQQAATPRGAQGARTGTVPAHHLK
jgi:8-oxo-dGTP pyrophosphatase MutT (NUDIX family)